MDSTALRGTLTELAAVLDERAKRLDGPGQAAPDEPRVERVRRLGRHLHEYLLPRLLHLDAPLLAVIIGSTGAGKSSLINALAGRRVSPSGVLRPTTRRPVVFGSARDAGWVTRGDLLPGLNARKALEVVSGGEGTRTGILLVDAPDVDSVEAENRELAAELLEAADLCIVVTTAARYADELPWRILERARQRRVPLLAVLNRLPDDEADAAAVLADYGRLLARARLDEAGAEGGLTVVPIAEGALDEATDGLLPGAVAAVGGALDRLAADRRRRRALAQRALAGALAGLPPALEEVAEDVDRERRTGSRLADAVERSYAGETEVLVDEIRHGTFLRAEVLRQWQAFVGAGQVSRLLATGIGRLASAVGGLLGGAPRPSAAPVEVQGAAFDDLVALAAGRAQEAARRTATEWSRDGLGAALLAADPRLWSDDGAFEADLRATLEGWIGEIGERIRVEGEGRRGFARAASLGLNVLGTGVMLSVFSSTGGLTGAEVGIAAATAALNQRLLEAVFGEATVRQLVSRARERLEVLLREALAEDAARYRTTLELALPGADLSARLRGLAGRVAAEAA